ncbi:MAG: glycosyltransferase family 4 protein [Candidatus Krumholzibacteriales bacterium]
MKKVLFLSHYFPPEVNAPARRTYEHAIKWIDNGLEVTVITNHPNHPQGKLYEGYRNRWLSKEQIDGIDVVRVKTFITPNRGMLKRGINFLFFMIMSVIASLSVKKPDVVIATSPQLFCGLAGTIIKRIKRAPLILEIRDLWPDSIIAVGALKECLIIKFLRRLEKYMYFSANKIVTLTDKFKEHIESLGYPAGKIATIPNSFDLNHLGEMGMVYSELKGKDKFICSYIGTFGMAHNLEIVLQAAKLLQEIKGISFLLVGDGSEKSTIVDKCEKMELDNVDILPLQPNDKILKFYKLSSVGLIMLKDSYLFRSVVPSKMFEYMAVKTPLLMSVPEGEATTIVKKYDCGVLCDPDSPESLAENIMHLFNNQDKLEYYGDNGYKAVMEKYNRGVFASKYQELIEAI